MSKKIEGIKETPVGLYKPAVVRKCPRCGGHRIQLFQSDNKSDPAFIAACVVCKKHMWASGSERVAWDLWNECIDSHDKAVIWAQKNGGGRISYIQ
jgi:hypothetical protein